MNIRELRQITNMTQNQFAEHFGIPVGTIRNWEQGIAQPPAYVLTMIINNIRRDKMINFETIKFIEMLKNLAELTTNGIEDFKNAKQDTFRTKIFYDSNKPSEDGNYPIVLDACIIDDQKCFHHDIISYYTSETGDYSINVVIPKDNDKPYITIKIENSDKEEILIHDGKWYISN